MSGHGIGNKEVKTLPGGVQVYRGDRSQRVEVAVQPQRADWPVSTLGIATPAMGL